MTSEFWWYVARSGGIVAWGLAAASVLWGLALSSGVFGARASGPKLLDLHRFLGGLSLVFVAVHAAGLLLAEQLTIGIVDLLVPMAADDQAGAIAWGVVAFYLLVAVEVTSLLRDRVGEKVWRLVHFAGFGVFLFGTIHGLRAGTDVDNPVIWWPAAVASAAAVGLCAYRIFAGDPVSVAPTKTERPSASLLERTLSELERFDTSAYPAPPPVANPVPAPPPPTQAARPSVWAAPSTTQSAPPSTPPAPAPKPEPLSMFSTGGPLTRRPQPPAAPPSQPPQPSRTSVSDSLLSRSLPTRTPQRLEATTAPAAGLGAWQPAARTDAVSVDAPVPPPPPDAVDPTTGDPDPAAYRKWLRDWLSYVESQP